MTPKKERALIAQAKRGDRKAMTALIRAHQDSLYAFMLRMSGKPDVAEDVVQEAFVRVLKNLDRFDTRYRFSTWLFTIAKRLYVNWAQKFRPTSETDLVGGWESSDVSPASSALMTESRHTTQDIVGRALARLGETQREIVLLFHQQSWSIAEIGEYLDMPEGTIKSHLHRARKKMKASILQESAANARLVAEVLDYEI